MLEVTKSSQVSTSSFQLWGSSTNDLSKMLGVLFFCAQIDISFYKDGSNVSGNFVWTNPARLFFPPHFSLGTNPNFLVHMMYYVHTYSVFCFCFQRELSTSGAIHLYFTRRLDVGSVSVSRDNVWLTISKDSSAHVSTATCTSRIWHIIIIIIH